METNIIKPKKVLFAPFPKQQEFLDAAFSGDYSFIVFGGAIRRRGEDIFPPCTLSTP
jgi:hypothetical protein